MIINRGYKLKIISAWQQSLEFHSIACCVTHLYCWNF